MLSTSGHIQALINPPGPDSRSSYRIAGTNPPELADWEAQAVTHRGSWWPDYIAWLEPRAGELVPAPKKLGSRVPQGDGEGAGNVCDGLMTQAETVRVPPGRWWGNHLRRDALAARGGPPDGRPGVARPRRDPAR